MAPGSALNRDNVSPRKAAAVAGEDRGLARKVAAAAIRGFQPSRKAEHSSCKARRLVGRVAGLTGQSPRPLWRT